MKGSAPIRVHLRASLAILTLGLAPAAALAQEEGGPRARELTPRAERAIEKGIGRLLEMQDPYAGHFGKKYKVASTSLAGLALLASGDTWGRGARSAAIEAAVGWLLSDTTRKPIPGKPGQCFFFDGEASGKMHANGFAMLFLAEVYGQTARDDEIRDALRGAVAAVIDAQTSLGGWGYHLRHDRDWLDDEASVTITQIQALRACRNAGIFVPAEVVARAVGYVKESMTDDGSCRYSLTMRGPEAKRTSFELTAAAVATLNASGIYLSGGARGEEELDRGLRFLRKAFRAYDSPAAAATDFYWYGNLYAAQAMFQATEEDWDFWFPLVRQELIEKQRPDGGWDDPRSFGEAYATASALLVLQLPRRYLPIFQR